MVVDGLHKVIGSRLCVEGVLGGVVVKAGVVRRCSLSWYENCLHASPTNCRCQCDTSGREGGEGVRIRSGKRGAAVGDVGCTGVQCWGVWPSRAESTYKRASGTWLVTCRCSTWVDSGVHGREAGGNTARAQGLGACSPPSTAPGRGGGPTTAEAL